MIATVSANPAHKTNINRNTYWSTDGFPAIVNAPGSFYPRILTTAQTVATTFPDAMSVEYLRELGVRSVILHPDLAAGTPWQDASRRTVIAELRLPVGSPRTN